LQYPNWFSVTAERPFSEHLRPFAGKPGLRFLQIGAFTGDASVWLLKHILTGEDCRLVDVDTWGGSQELAHEQFDWADVERTYNEKVCGLTDKWKTTSEDFFRRVTLQRYDFIYIDGAHDAYTCLNDGVSAYKRLKVGGLLAFDDYQWHSGRGLIHDPQPAIDAIGFIYGDRLEPVEIGSQAWFRRVA
jgi:predicted O-methyltransferase YrrM